MKSGREQRIERHGKSCRVAPNIHADSNGYLKVTYKSKWLKGTSWTLGHAQAKLALAKANELEATYEDLHTKADAAQIIALRIETARHDKRMQAIKEARRTALDSTYLQVGALEEQAAEQNIKPWEI
jgi:hypothetical protein